MKSIKKIIFGAVALAALSCFVSCKQNQDPQEVAVSQDVAVYESEENWSKFSSVSTITFSKGNIYNFEEYYKTEDKSLHVRSQSGTYEGDPTKDGNITVKITKSSSINFNGTDATTPSRWEYLKLKEVENFAGDEMRFIVSHSGQTLTLDKIDIKVYHRK